MEQKSNSTGKITLNTRRLQDIMARVNIEHDDEDGDVIDYSKSEEEIQQLNYTYLWSSELKLLQGMCNFMHVSPEY
jgi:hypothetical protein